MKEESPAVANDDTHRPATIPGRVRLFALLFPPAGLWLLWRGDGIGFARKLLGSIGILLYTIPYCVMVVWLLMWFGGLEFEWRGGMGPVLTFSKTRPDYAAIEASRGLQPDRITATNSNAFSSAYWTDFRGPARDGRYQQLSLLPEWPANGPPRLWRQPIGGGYASFVIAEGRAFTIEQRRDMEAVTAYDVSTGVELWQHGYPARFEEWMGGEGPRATPTWHQGRVFSLGAEGNLICLAATNGAVLWEHHVLEENGCSNLPYAMACSPLIVDDTLVVLAGEVSAPEGSSVIACDWRTGDMRWKALTEKMAYTSPMLVELAGQRQILIVSASHVLGLSPKDGGVLWRHPWKVQYENAIAQPVIVSTNRFLLSAGYNKGCALFELNSVGDKFQARELWRNRNLKNKFNSSVFWRGCVYGLDEGILTCLDVESGNRKWKDGRYGYGQLLLADGHLVILSGDGELALVRATPERFEELARFQAIDGKTWNNPAISDGLLLVRNSAEMACFDLRPRPGEIR